MLSASGREVSIKNCYKEFGKLALSWIFPQIFGIKLMNYLHMVNFEQNNHFLLYVFELLGFMQ